MKRFLLAAFLMLCIFGGAAVGHAQVRGTGIGPKIGLYLDGSLFMVGVTGEIPLSPEFDFEPAGELVLGVSNTTRLILDANGRYSFNILGSDVRPFVLGGVGLALDLVNAGGVSSTRSDFRLNIGAGAIFSSRSLIQPWGGLKIILLSRQSDVAIQGGVNFYL